MYFEKDDNSGDDFVFDYFNHIVIPSPSEISAFVRNATNKTYILNWDSIIQYTPPLNNLITFNTPQFFEANTYNEYINLSKKETNWVNLYRMDSKENSYSYIKNTENDILGVDDITVHFENLNIPESAIIEKMYLKSII